MSFDPEKAQCCIVENGQILSHGSGGKGYGLASTGVTSGCYQWKVGCINVYFLPSLLLFWKCAMFYEQQLPVFFTYDMILESMAVLHLWLDSIIMRMFSSLSHSVIFQCQGKSLCLLFEWGDLSTSACRLETEHVFYVIRGNGDCH